MTDTFQIFRMLDQVKSDGQGHMGELEVTGRKILPERSVRPRSRALQSKVTFGSKYEQPCHDGTTIFTSPPGEVQSIIVMSRPMSVCLSVCRLAYR